MFVFDILILLLGYVIAHAFVIYNKTLTSLLIPIPVNNSFEYGKQVEFKFLKYSEAKQSEGGDILVLMIFIILTFLSKLFFLSGESWTVFWIGFGIISAFQLLSIFNVLIIFFFGLIYALPWLISSMIFGFDQHYKWTGLIAGVIPGLYGGFFMGRNFFLARAKIKRELIKKQTISGVRITKLGNIVRRIKFSWITIAPLFTLLAIISFFSGSQSVIAKFLADYSTEFKFIAYIVWALVSLNVFIFSVPMILEMLQQGTWFTAGVFNKHVVEKKEDTVKNAYLDKDGKYQSFNFGTTFILAIISLSVGILIAGDVLNKLINVNFRDIQNTHSELVILAEILAGFICAINIGFFISLLGNSNKSSKFTIRDIKDSKGLMSKILNSEDPVSIYIREILTSKEIETLEKSKNSGFSGKAFLASALNKICKRKDFNQPERFKTFHIPEDLFSPEKYILDLKKSNRTLLEWVYSDFLSVHNISQHIKSAKENIDFIADIYKDSEEKFSIVTGAGFYVNVSKVE